MFKIIIAVIAVIIIFLIFFKSYWLWVVFLFASAISIFLPRLVFRDEKTGAAMGALCFALVLYFAYQIENNLLAKEQHKHVEICGKVTYFSKQIRLGRSSGKHYDFQVTTEKGEVKSFETSYPDFGRGSRICVDYIPSEDSPYFTEHRIIRITTQ